MSERACRDCKYCADVEKSADGTTDLMVCCVAPHQIPRTTLVPCVLLDVQEALSTTSREAIDGIAKFVETAISLVFGGAFPTAMVEVKEEETH